MKAFIDRTRKVEGISEDTRIAGISLKTRLERTLEKAGYHESETEEEADRVLDWATIYHFNENLELIYRIESIDDLSGLEDKLWNACRKDLDGIISKNHNRHISLFISRRIAAFGVSPNYISLLTFSLGMLSGILAGFGEYAFVFIAGILFQLTSVVDGVDGELARVKLEFSLLGEWLDTISDDSSDLAFYAGLGIGALQVNYRVGFISPTLFLILAIVSVVGKLLSMFFYYRALIAKNRGDLYAFDWDINEPPTGLLGKISRGLRYITKNDFIAFSAFVLAALGYAPLLLLASAPGTLIVTLSVVKQTLRNSKQT